MFGKIKHLLFYFLCSPIILIISKEITVPSSNDTFIYQEYISSPEVKFEFEIKKNAILKIELLNEADDEGRGYFNLSYYYYKREFFILVKKEVTLINNEEINIGKGYNKTQSLTYIEHKQTFTLSYTYSKNHTILLKFLFLEAEFYKLDFNNNIENQPILNIVSIYDNEFYLNISLNNFENDANLYTKIIQDNFHEIEEILCLQKDDIENYNSNQIIEMFNNTTEMMCDDLYLSSNNITIITNQKKSDRMFIKLKLKILDNNVINKNNIYLSLFKENLVEFDSGKYVKEISKYNGFYLILNLSKFENNFDYLMYSNISKSMKIYGLTEDEKNTFKFNETKGTLFEYSKILSINSIEKLNNISYIIFVDKTIKEDFSFILLQINNSEASISVNTYPNYKNEIINFQSLKNENELSTKYIIMVNDYQKINDAENFFYFYEEIDGSVQAKIFDLDNNKYLKETKNKFDPQIIPEYSSVLIILNTNGDYKYKMYMLKCLSYNNTEINYGDNIQICLNPKESTKLNLQPSPKYTVKLLISESTDIQYSIKIKISTENSSYYINNTNKEFYREEVSSNYYISLINDGNFTSIINFKLSINDLNNINYIENSIDETIIENGKLYALLLPKNSQIKEINSIYQELNFKGENSELCFDFDTNKNNITTYPPKNSCFNYSNEIYNFNLTLLENNEDNYYTYLYLKKSFLNSVSLNYKHVLIYDKGIIENITNNITNTKDICYLQFINYENNTYLFLQIIKESLKNLEAQIVSKYIDKNNKTKFKTLKTSKRNNNGYILTNFTKFEPSDIIPYLKLTSPQNLLIYCKFSNNISEIYFQEIEDPGISGELDNGQNKYILNFKPVDKKGTAIYNIIVIEENPNLPSLEKLSNPYFLLSQNYNSTKIQATSFDSSFQTTEDLFKIDILNNSATYYIAIIAQRIYPISYKVYLPIFTKTIETTEKFINLTEIKNNSNYSIEVQLTNNEQQLIITVFHETSGTLLIQSVTDEEIVVQTGYIYYKTQRNSTELMYYLNNFISFPLRINTELDQYFDIKILFQKNQTENITQKLFLEFISAEVVDDYNEKSEIKYRILNDVSIPYYINSTNDFEIIKMKKNFNEIIINSILVKVYGDNITNITKYEENNIMKFNDDYYFELYYQRENIRTYYLEISVNLNNSNNIFENDVREFTVIRMKAYNLKDIKENINVSNVTGFYYLDLAELNNKQYNYTGLLLYSRNLKNAANFHLGTYNSFANQLKMSESFHYIEKNSFKNKNYILVLFLYYETKYKGAIDYYYMNNKQIDINYNCDRTSFYNRNKTFEELENGEKYYICYTKNNTKKYRFSYETNPENSANEIIFGYNNEISNKENLIEEIFNNTKKKVVEDNFCKMEGKIEILYLKYNITNGHVILTMKANNYEYIQGEKSGGMAFSLSIMFTLLLIAIGIYIYKAKNGKTESDYIINKQVELIDGDIMD